MSVHVEGARLDHNSTIASLPYHGVSFAVDERCSAIAGAFERQPNLSGVLIFKDAVLQAMISRSRFMEIMQLPYGKELFLQKKIKKLMVHFKKPSVTFSLDTNIGQAVEEVLERNEQDLAEPIVVTGDHSYFIVDTHLLLHAHARIFARTVKTLEAEIDRSNALRDQLEVAHREAEKIARIDGLTGIANRRHLDEYLPKEFKRAARNNAPISIVLIDIDFFKAYNDAYGHQAGDDALIRVTQCLTQHVLRPADMLARYGGEEFIIILPDTPADGALSLAEQMRRAVLKLNIPHAHSMASDYVTISCGVFCGDSRQEAVDVDQAIHCADDALYAAKTRGRNCVVRG